MELPALKIGMRHVDCATFVYNKAFRSLEFLDSYRYVHLRVGDLRSKVGMGVNPFFFLGASNGHHRTGGGKQKTFPPLQSNRHRGRYATVANSLFWLSAGNDQGSPGIPVPRKSKPQMALWGSGQ